MEYHFRAPAGTGITLTGVASVTDHLFSTDAATTATWLPGTYSGVCRVIDANAQVTTIWRGTLEIKPELAAQPDEYDSRSWAKRCLDKIEAVIEGRATRDVLNSTIAGQSIGRMTPEQLFTMRATFASKVESENNADAGKNRNIFYRFIAP